jgi:hypothetical protein
VILGTALPGLVAAVRLGMHGARILVLEEAEGRRAFPGLREPFLLTGTGGGTPLGTCLQALGLALIDRRRIEAGPLAYQVALPEARVDVGEPRRLASELVAWGLAKPDATRDLLRALADSSAAERAALLSAPLVPAGRRLPKTAVRPATPPVLSPSGTPRHARGLPAEVRSASGLLAPLFAAQIRALSNLGAATPSPEACARLLGAALEGGAEPGEVGLRELLRRRITSLYGEFRALSGRFRLVSAAKQPGVQPEGGSELLLGRALVLNAPHHALARWVDQDPVPPALRRPAATHRRVSLHLRAWPEVVPEGMAPRVICVRSVEDPQGTDVVRIQRWPGKRERDPVDLVASAVVPADTPDPADEIEAAVLGLMPFAEGRLSRQPGVSLHWDTDEWLADPPPGAGWPAEVEIRLSSRPPVYTLERSGVAGLAAEGDFMLGWRAGDAIAAELA